jgi:hypothetical protein
MLTGYEKFDPSGTLNLTHQEPIWGSHYREPKFDLSGTFGEAFSV